MANELKIKLIKSVIGNQQNIRRTVIALGLTRTNKLIVRKNTPELRGMLAKVGHLVAVEEI